MYEGEDDINIDILSEVPTTERNGVKVIVPVKYQDRYEFQDKIKEQLAYFEGVFFDCEGVSNNFTIHRHELFQWSELNTDASMHLCLDNVYYPLDFNKLGISDIRFPVALRFSLTDGIFPVPNREQLKYTKEAKEKILSKIAQVAEYFVQKYNEKISQDSGLFDLFQFYYSSDKRIEWFKPGSTQSISNLLPYAVSPCKEPVIKGVEGLTSREIFELKDYLTSGLEVSHEYVNGRISSTTNKYNKSLTIRDVENYPVYLYKTEFPTGNRRTYLKDEVLQYGKRYHFVFEKYSIKLGDFRDKYNTHGGKLTYYHILKLWLYPKSDWRKLIKDFQYLRSLVFQKFLDLDAVQVPQEWLDDRKKQRVQKMVQKGTNVRRTKLEGEITIKLSERLERYVSGKNCKFVNTIIDLKTAHKNKYLIIYGKDKNESLFQKLYNGFDNSKIKFGILSDREHKKVAENVDLHNWISIEKFMEGKHIVFKRAVTSYLIDELKDKNSSVFNKIQGLSKISSDLAEKVQILYDYYNKYYSHSDEEVLKSMVKVAEEHKLFDYSVYGVYLEVKQVLDKLTFLQPMFVSMSYNVENDTLFNPTKDLFRYYKFRMNWDNYVLQLNEDVVDELSEQNLEQITEEAI